MDTLKYIQKFAKKNKKLFLTFSCFLLVFVIELTIAYVSQIASDIDETSKNVRTNTTNIAHIQKDVEFYNNVFRSVVTRNSFNDYVRHTDDRFKEEQESDSGVFKDIGKLDGRVTGMEKVVYALNLYEIKKQIPSNKTKEDGLPCDTSSHQ